MQCRVSSVALLLEFWVLSACALHQYHLVNMNLNWTAAQSYCREHYVDLATLDSMEDMQNMLNQTGLVNDHFWKGLTRDSVSSWKWSLSGSQFYREGETEYRNWAQPEPITGQPCAALVSNETGVWRDYACTNTYSFVCSNSGKDPGKPNYILVLGPRTWRDAQLYCRQSYTDLASIRNQAENIEIQQLVLGENSSAIVWIGLFKDDWKWSDGSTSSFRYWRNGHPGSSYDCVLTHTHVSWQWTPEPCSSSFYLICHNGSITNTTILSTLGTTTGSTTKTPTKVMLVGRVDLVPNSPSDLEDPAMLDSILQQMKAAGRIPEHSTLRWKKQKDGKVFHKKEEEEGGRGDTCH
ncbi:macrophage mannose receptor 1-like isoform X1 [Hypomesus transpacificus]|uniref:macrophage mannose receptor 1-like isoform X1 n=1 Tax=Hypomesus transpacificus TaxID=137520 RepID=UPI001F0748A8|nr:macrophage mannose receptor 1-like isoform X1 [Hypomesus transpacificus]XP_046887712.1 macrophage mannose receptor 1-like isoform X1 [Hypomesus transpacificus]